MNIPSILCSLTALAALACAIAMLIAAILMVKCAWTGIVSPTSDKVRELSVGAVQMRNAAIATLAVLFVIASDAVYVYGLPRLQACSVLCHAFAGSMVPALLVTLAADVICIFKRNSSSTLADLRSVSRGRAFFGIVIGLVLSYLFSA